MSFFQKLSKHYPKIPGYRRLRPRRCQVFAVGSPKTGTHSLVSLFEKNFRAMHEAEAKEEIALFARYQQGLCQSGEVGQWFLERSNRFWLECDVSHLHGFFAAEIAQAIPEAKFILTLREPYAWLDSAFNQTLGRPLNSHWSKLRKLVYGPLPSAYPEQESVLQQYGLYPVAALLNRWAGRIEHITQTIPCEKLLIIKTTELKQSADKIATFCEIERKLLSAERGHQFPAAIKTGLLDKIDRAYLDNLIEQRCGKILAQYFPD
ncbi:MAG: sulfotransferase [Arenimonas sp.]